MKVRMKISLSGSRDGQAWPDKGGIIDLPTTEAAAMCAAGMAEPADGHVEAAIVNQPAETATVATKPKRGRPPGSVNKPKLEDPGGVPDAG